MIPKRKIRRKQIEVRKPWRRTSPDLVTNDLYFWDNTLLAIKQLSGDKEWIDIHKPLAQKADLNEMVQAFVGYDLPKSLKRIKDEVNKENNNK